MSDWPGFGVPMPDIVVGPQHLGGVGLGNMAAATSGTWALANLAVFFPFRLDRPRLIVKLFCFNGTAVSGNVDLGIYDRAGTKLVSSGSTAQAGTSAIQSFDITDTLLGAEHFYLAMSCDNTTATVMRGNQFGIQVARLGGARQMASAFPLPATATFAAINTGGLYGLAATTRSVV